MSNPEQSSDAISSSSRDWVRMILTVVCLVPALSYFLGLAIGLAFGEIRGETFLLSENHGTIGWTAGAGVEMALNKNWSAKAEYLYVDLSDKNFTITGLPNGYQFGVIRLGVNYHF